MKNWWCISLLFLSILMVGTSCHKERKKNYNHLYPELVGEWEWIRTDWYWEDQFGVHGIYLLQDSARYHTRVSFSKKGVVKIYLEEEEVFKSKYKIWKETPSENDSTTQIYLPPTRSFGMDFSGGETIAVMYFTPKIEDTIMLNRYPINPGVVHSDFSLHNVFFNEEDTYHFDRIINYFVRVK